MDAKEKITDYTVDEIITICNNAGDACECEDCPFASSDDCLFNYDPTYWCEVYKQMKA